MCCTCGCGVDDVRISGGHLEHHAHDHSPHDHSPHDHSSHDYWGEGPQAQEEPDRTHTLGARGALLARNDRLAEPNRRWLRERGIRAINLMSSPGSGKTTVARADDRRVGESGLGDRG